MNTKKSLAALLLVLFAFGATVFAADDFVAGIAGKNGGGRNPGGPRYSSLTDGEKATLIYMREEEKLARDVYIKMHELWGETVFSNISVAEQRHMDAVLGLLVKFGIPDPVQGLPIGTFKNAELQELYNDLVSMGEASLRNALTAGKMIEEKDIRDLQAAIAEAQAWPLDKVYGNLLKGSLRHLEAFNNCLAALN